jgi:hypothetical protein
MVDLIRRIQAQGPQGSVLVVEADELFDFELLHDKTGADLHAAWDVRKYAPAVVGLWRN